VGSNMKIISLEELVVSMAVKLLSKGGNCLYGALDPHGRTTVQGGASKKKVQFIKTDFCIPHEIINDKYKEDISVINHAFIGPMAGIPTIFLNEKGLEMRDEAKKHANTRFEKSPRLKAAVEELVEAIKEEAKRLTDEDKKE